MSERDATSNRGPAIAAAVTGLLVPGLPQFRAGNAVRGAIAFVSVVGLFSAGYAMLGERFWFHETFGGEFSMQGTLGTILRPVWALVGTLLGVLPESLALGPSIVVSLTRAAESPAVERLQRLPVDGEWLGYLMTTSAGILSALWAADAAWIAAGRRTFSGSRPAVAAMLSWIVPGLGYLSAPDRGTRQKGVLCGAVVFVLFALGCLLAGGQAVDRGNNSVWWIGQSLAGCWWCFAAFLSPIKLTDLPWGYDLGVVLTTVAGLLNAVLMVDVYTIAERGAAAAAIAGAGRDADLDTESPTAPGQPLVGVER